MGADNIENFYKWRNVDEILLNKIIVLNRNNININKYLKNYPKQQFIPVTDFPFINVSSTEIRNGKFKHIHPEVIKYIKELKDITYSVLL